MCIASLFKTPKVTMPSIPAPVAAPPPPEAPTVTTPGELAPIRKRLGKSRFKSGALGGTGMVTGDSASTPSTPLGLPGIRSNV